MAIKDQGIVRPLSVNEIFRFQPYYKELPYVPAEPSTAKGTEIFDAVLLDQYQNKDNLRKYFLAFIEELDVLFNSIDQVYHGRMIDRAIGAQLDAIGRIIDQGREVIIPGGEFFGVVESETPTFPTSPTTGDEFTESGRVYTWNGDRWIITSTTRIADVEAHKMADKATPGDGGVFKDGWYGNFITIPLNDREFRNILKAKAGLHNRHNISHNQVYTAVSTVLGRTPRHMKINYTGVRRFELELSVQDVTTHDQNLVQYFSQYFAPLGVMFEVVPVNII